MSCFVQVGVKNWLFNNVKDICSPTQKNDLTCPHNQVFFTASAVWCVTPSMLSWVDGRVYRNLKPAGVSLDRPDNSEQAHYTTRSSTLSSLERSFPFPSGYGNGVIQIHG